MARSFRFAVMLDAPDPPSSLERQRPLAELFAVAAPSVLAMLSYPLKQFIDARMVAVLGDTAVAGQGNGAIVALIFMAAFAGTLTVVNTFASQCVGAGRERDAPAYAWNGLWIALAGGALVAVVASVIDDVFRLLGHSAELLATETGYARVLLLTAFFPIAARGIAYFFYGVHKPAIVVAAMLAGLIVNVGCNYLLIEGRLGFPRLEVVGAGVATAIASATEFAIPFAVFLLPRMHRRFRTRGAWRLSITHVGRLWRVGWPAGLMFANELLCWGLFLAAIIPLLGEAHNTASWIALRYMSLSFMPAVGLQIAVTAVVGRHLGRGDPDAAHHRAMLGVALGMAYMGAFALAMVIFRKPMVSFFLTEAVEPERMEEILRIGSRVMILAAVFQVFDALGIILIGALRGAGDTLYPGVSMALLAWGVLIPGSLAAVKLAPQWGSAGPWAIAAVYIILVGVVMSVRYARGSWRSMRLVEQRPTGEENSPVSAPAALATPVESSTT